MCENEYNLTINDCFTLLYSLQKNLEQKYLVFDHEKANTHFWSVDMRTDLIFLQMLWQFSISFVVHDYENVLYN